MWIVNFYYMISIIIPILNETKTITDTVNAVFKNLSGEIESELILVDGGSKDGTLKKAETMVCNSTEFRKQFSIRLMHSTKGRARQDLGAEKSEGRNFILPSRR